MEFFEHSNEERNDWRQHDVTKAFLGHVRHMVSEQTRHALNLMCAGDAGQATSAAGAEAALRQVIEHAERDV